METALRSLRDIDGVLGSFLLDHRGQLLARDMPGVFDEGTLCAASQRLGQLRAAFEADGHSFDGCTARFGAHLLVLRAAQKRTLCVVCPLGTNLTTLQMGINLVARRAADVPDHTSLWPPAPRASEAPAAPQYAPRHASVAPAASVPPRAPVRDSAPPMEPIAAEPQSTTRFFRGRPVP